MLNLGECQLIALHPDGTAYARINGNWSRLCLDPRGTIIATLDEYGVTDVDTGLPPRPISSYSSLRPDADALSRL